MEIQVYLFSKIRIHAGHLHKISTKPMKMVLVSEKLSANIFDKVGLREWLVD